MERVWTDPVNDYPLSVIHYLLIVNDYPLSCLTSPVH